MNNGFHVGDFAHNIGKVSFGQLPENIINAWQFL
jgi:hypothetical protein